MGIKRWAKKTGLSMTLAAAFFFGASWDLVDLDPPGTQMSASMPGAYFTVDGAKIRYRLPAIDGGFVSSDATASALSLCFIWATWCQPCREEAEWLEQATRRFGSHGLSLLGICLDSDAQAVRHYMKISEFRFPCALLPADLLPAHSPVKTVPMLFLISHAGDVIRTFSGLVPYAQVAESIETALTAAAAPTATPGISRP